MAPETVVSLHLWGVPLRAASPGAHARGRRPGPPAVGARLRFARLLGTGAGRTFMNHFAYERPAHLSVVGRTEPERWYAEELFARFAVLSTRGRLDGVDPVSGAG